LISYDDSKYDEPQMNQWLKVRLKREISVEKKILNGLNCGGATTE
jgi:hypothetical protein